MSFTENRSLQPNLHPQDAEGWKLKLCKRADWEKQYSGFDPKLVLPWSFNNDVAQHFLVTLFRFADCQAGRKNDLDVLYQAIAERGSAQAMEVAKKAWFSTPAIDKSGIILISSAIDEYLEKYAKLSKHDIKILFRDAEKMSFNMFEQKAEIFSKFCRQTPNVSVRGFFEYLAENKKIQYIEPTLLYIGSALKQVAEYIKTSDAIEISAEDKEKLLGILKEVAQDYKDTGLASAVAFNRALANTHEAKAQTRVWAAQWRDTGASR